MSLMNDFGDLFGDIAEIKEEMNAIKSDVIREVSGLKDETVKSMADIDQGVKRDSDALKQKFTKPLRAMEGFKKPAQSKTSRKIDIK